MVTAVNNSGVAPVVEAPKVEAPATTSPATPTGSATNTQNPSGAPTAAPATGTGAGDAAGKANTAAGSQAPAGNSSATAGNQMPGADFSFDFSKINSGTNELPDLPGANNTSDTSELGTSRRDQLNSAFENALSQAKQGDAKPLTNLIDTQASLNNQLAQEVEDSAAERGRDGKSEGEVESRRTDVYGRVAENVAKSKGLYARLAEEASLAESKNDKYLTSYYTQQSLKLKTSSDKAAQAVETDEAQNAFADTEKKAKEFGKLTKTPHPAKPLTAEQAKKMAELTKGEFKAGDIAQGRKPKPNAKQAAQQTAQKTSVSDQSLAETVENKEIANPEVEENSETIAREAVEHPSKEQLEEAHKKVAAFAGDPKTKEERLDAAKKQREKMQIARVALNKATETLPEDAGQKALAEGAKRVYRDTNRQAFDDVLGGQSSLAGLVFLGAEEQSLSELVQAPSQGVRGQNTVASLSSGNEKEINPQDAPKQLAALNKETSSFDEMPILSLFQWKPRSERAPSVRDLISDGASRGQVAV